MTSFETNRFGEGDGGGTATLTFEATDVTGTHNLVASGVAPGLTAGVVARALAEKMSLPLDVPYALRGETSEYLDDAAPIGDQVTTNARLTLTPKTHLG